jgi:hypothetical protein
MSFSFTKKVNRMIEFFNFKIIKKLSILDSERLENIIKKMLLFGVILIFSGGLLTLTNPSPIGSLLTKTIGSQSSAETFVFVFLNLAGFGSILLIEKSLKKSLIQKSFLITGFVALSVVLLVSWAIFCGVKNIC